MNEIQSMMGHQVSQLWATTEVLVGQRTKFAGKKEVEVLKALKELE